jgi:hypothetical protein
VVRPALLMLLLLAGAAEAAPRSARLLPTVPAPGPRLLASTPGDPLPEIPVDPHARGIVLREVAVGAAMVVGADLVSAVFGGAVGGVTWLSSSDPLLSIVAGYVGFLMVNFVLAPAAAALGAYSVAPDKGNNGLLGAALGAGLAHLAFTAVFVGTSLGLGVFLGVFRAQTLASQGGALGISLLILAVHWVVLPVGASLGIHWTAPEPERRAQPPPATPHQTYAQALLRPAPVLTLRF